MTTDNTAVVLGKLLDLTSIRHQVLANNLANVNTPKFTRQDLDFSEEFAQAVKQGAGAVQSLHLEPIEDTEAPARFDGNNVQLETEMAEMSKNGMLHQMALQLMRAHISMQRMAVTGRSF